MQNHYDGPMGIFEGYGDFDPRYSKVSSEEFYSEDFDVDDLLRDNGYRESEGLDDWQSDFPAIAEVQCSVCGAGYPSGSDCDKCVYPPPRTTQDVINDILNAMF